MVRVGALVAGAALRTVPAHVDRREAVGAELKREDLGLLVLCSQLRPHRAVDQHVYGWAAHLAAMVGVEGGECVALVLEMRADAVVVDLLLVGVVPWLVGRGVRLSDEGCISLMLLFLIVPVLSLVAFIVRVGFRSFLFLLVALLGVGGQQCTSSGLFGVG